MKTIRLVPAKRAAAAAVFAIVVGLLTAGPAMACNSGPDFCTDDPRIPAALAAKKKEMLKDFPARLVNLLDRGVQCIARIERSPDIFTMVVVSGNMIETVPWDATNEKNALKMIDSGDIKRFWIVNARRAFSCDGHPSYDQQPDYDANDDVNTSLALKCGDGGSC